MWVFLRASAWKSPTLTGEQSFGELCLLVTLPDTGDSTSRVLQDAERADLRRQLEIDDVIPDKVSTFSKTQLNKMIGCL